MPIDKVASDYIIALVANGKLDQPHLPREPDGLRPAQKYFKTLPWTKPTNPTVKKTFWLAAVKEVAEATDLLQVHSNVSLPVWPSKRYICNLSEKKNSF